MRSKRAAFTLVELLVVIGIIALLIAVLLPALGRARAQANTVKCMSNLRQVSTYLSLYATEQNNYFLPAGAVYFKWEYGDWYGVIARLYFKADMEKNGAPLTGAAAFSAMDKTGLPKLLECPSFDRAAWNPAAGYSTTPTNENKTETPVRWSYIYNAGLGDASQTLATNDQLAQFGFKKKNVVPPGVFVMADMAPYLPNGRGTNNYRFFNASRNVDPLDGSWLTIGGQIGQPHGIASAPRTNALFADGSVQTINLKNMHNLPNRYMVDARDWCQNPGHSTNKKKEISMKSYFIP